VYCGLRSPFADSLICRFADLRFACSLSHRAAASLRPGVTGRVLASFRSVCDLVTDAGEVVALVGPGIGNGPLNVVLDQGWGAALSAGARFVVADQVVHVEAVKVDFSRATRWDARPDWDRLRACHVPGTSQVPGPSGVHLLAAAGPAVEAAVAAFQQAWRGGSIADLQLAICNLLGLGPGLTPAGDDWLAGWLLGQHLGGDLREPAPSRPKGLRDLEGLIVEVAAERTTTLSRAFLACAAAGEADEAWHELLDALAKESANQRISESANQRIEEAAARILRHGATSGAAMLAGFFASLAASDS
jgi:hypothetical protein